MQKTIFFLTGISWLIIGCGDSQTKSKEIAVTQTTPPPQTVTSLSEPTPFDAVAIYAQKCASCHGTNGEGKGIFPKLAGQSSQIIAEKLIGYKNNTFGGDKKTMMIPNAKALSDQEISKIAKLIGEFK